MLYQQVKLINSLNRTSILAKETDNDDLYVKKTY